MRATGFLKESGKLIPHRLELFLVPVELPQFYEHVIDFWVTGCQGLDFSPVRELTVNNFHPLKLHDGTFLSDPTRVEQVVLGETKNVEVRCPSSLSSPIVEDGCMGWPAGSMPNSCRDSLCRMVPVGASLSLGAGVLFQLTNRYQWSGGNRIVAEIASTGNGEDWHWRLEVNGRRFEQSTHRGTLQSGPSRHPKTHIQLGLTSPLTT